jgi:hypothetical protein
MTGLCDGFIRLNGCTDQKLGLLFTAVNTGLTAGALIWGVLVDVIGKFQGLHKQNFHSLTSDWQVENGPSMARSWCAQPSVS